MINGCFLCSGTMAAQEATPHSHSEENSVLDLPSAADIRDYVLQRRGQEATSGTFSSVETFSLPCSSDVEPDSSNQDATKNDFWSSENFWLNPSMGQAETKAENDSLRKSLDRFYEMFGPPQPASGNRLSAAVCQHLTQKILTLSDQEGQKYNLRRFQLARAILSQDGCSVLQRHSRDTHFYPLGEGSVSLDVEKPTPGLSKDILHFLLKQGVMKDP
ncbi:shieldin complex subunit 1 [Sorex fumeus]|uniref:shieldin complex subunit 1 n=1 Tax=Sorex fumeus TaxID=62283 RepID=UPI0024AD09F1|nr:shieldin complex subunit 1 [Sorex fumeus]